MRTEEAVKLRLDWAVKGNLPCSHHVLDNEYYWGEYTGSYLCTACGKSFTHEEWEQEIRRIENELESNEDSCTIRQPGRFRKGIKGFLNQCEKLHTFLSQKVINECQRSLIKLQAVMKRN